MSSKFHQWGHANKHIHMYWIILCALCNLLSKVIGFKLPNLICLDSFSSLVWSRNSVLPSPLVSWSLKTSHFMAPIGIEAWLHTEAENSINLIQYCHHIPNWLETISSLSLCYFYFLEKFAVYRYLNSFGYPVAQSICTHYSSLSGWADIFSRSQKDPCFQNKISGCRLTGQLCVRISCPKRWAPFWFMSAYKRTGCR